MAHTNVLLREDIDELGARGEIVRVKAGYARNYLLPRKLAVEAREKATAEGQADQLRAVRLSFTRKVGEHGILYGSVTSMDIAEALKERGYEVDRRRITLREPIKETGEFTVPVRLHREVIVELPVEVTAEGGAKPEAGAAEPAAAA